MKLLEMEEKKKNFKSSGKIFNGFRRFPLVYCNLLNKHNDQME